MPFALQWPWSQTGGLGHRGDRVCRLALSSLFPIRMAAVGPRGRCSIRCPEDDLLTLADTACEFPQLCAARMAAQPHAIMIISWMYQWDSNTRFQAILDKLVLLSYDNWVGLGGSGERVWDVGKYRATGVRRGRVHIGPGSPPLNHFESSVSQRYDRPDPLFRHRFFYVLVVRPRDLHRHERCVQRESCGIVCTCRWGSGSTTTWNCGMTQFCWGLWYLFGRIPCSLRVA
jgi:hypothetical protein